MKNLGNYLGLFFGVFALPLFAAVSASVDDTNVVRGDNVVYTISISGNDIEPPQINQLCGESIQSTQQSTNVQAINGHYTRTQRFAYTFMPVKSCTIDPVAVKVDGKYESTDAVKINVVPMKRTKDSPFLLDMKSDKSEVFVGEPFKLTVVFKQRHGAEAVDSKFEAPTFKNLWIKEELQSRRFEEGDYTVIYLTYIVAAQRAGTIDVEPVKIQIAQRSQSRDSWGMWFQSLKWHSYFSNGLSLEAKTLPQGATLVGNFSIEAEADKREIDANDAVNVTVKIKGSGNFEDIGSLKSSIAGVSIFEEEPTSKGYVEQEEYRGVWQQKLAFVGSHDFTVPPFSITYYDLQSGALKTIKTEPINVKVKNAKPLDKEEPLKITRASETQALQQGMKSEAGIEQLAGALIAGIAIGIALMLLPWRRLAEGRKRERSVSFKDEKALLNKLMQHMDDEEVKAVVEQLEAKLYGGENIEVERHRIKTLIKKYQF